MVNLREAEKIEVTTIIDNYVDLNLRGSRGVERASFERWEWLVEKPLLAEHGLSLLITLYRDGEVHRVLFDGGWSTSASLQNMKTLGFNPSEIEAAVLSHGHMDHFGGLAEILKAVKVRIPLIVHPDAFQPNRYFQLPTGKRIRLPSLSEESLKKAEVVKSRKPQTLASNLLATTGEIERTSFEKGPSGFYLEPSGEERDFILDDQAVFAKLRKGLVIISGCAHSGIINTISHIQRLCQRERVYAVVGGFHLGGSTPKSLVEETVQRLKRFNPTVVSPMHCTGWEAVRMMAAEMPNSFVLNSVGSTLIFE